MIKIETNCVACGLPCTHESCPFYNVKVHYCDICGYEADYCIDNEDLCEECAKKVLKNVFEDESVSKQAKILGFNYEKY